MEVVAWIKQLITEEKVSKSVAKGARGRTANFGVEYEFFSSGDREAVASFLGDEMERLGLPVTATFKDTVKLVKDFRRKVKGRKAPNKYDVLSHARVTKDPSLMSRDARTDPDAELDREKVSKDFIKHLRGGSLRVGHYREWLKDYGAEIAQEKLGRKPTDDELQQARDLQKLARYFVRASRMLAAGRLDKFQSDRFSGTEDSITDAVAKLVAKSLIETIPKSEQIRKGQGDRRMADHYLTTRYYEEPDLKFTEQFHEAALKLAKRGRAFVNDLFDIPELDGLIASMEQKGTLRITSDAVFQAVQSRDFVDHDFIPRVKVVLDKHVSQLFELLKELREIAEYKWGDGTRPFYAFYSNYSSILENILSIMKIEKSTDWSSYTMDEYEDAQGFAGLLTHFMVFAHNNLARIEGMAGDLSSTTADQFSGFDFMQEMAHSRQRNTLSRMARADETPFIPDNKKFEPTGKHHKQMREGKLEELEPLDPDEIAEAFKAGEQKAFLNELPTDFLHISVFHRADRVKRLVDESWVDATMLAGMGRGEFLDAETIAQMESKSLAGLIPALGFGEKSDEPVGVRDTVRVLFGRKLRPNDFLPDYGEIKGEEGKGRWADPFADEYDEIFNSERERIRDEGYGQTDDGKYGVEIVLPPLAMDEKNMRGVATLLDRVNQAFDGETTTDTGLHLHIGIWDQNVPMTVILSMMLLIYENERQLMQLGGRYASTWAASTRKLVRVLAKEIAGSAEGSDRRPYTFSSPSAFLNSMEEQVGSKFVGLSVSSWRTGTIELRYAKAIEGEALYQYMAFIKSVIDQAKNNANGFTYDFTQLTKGRVKQVRIEPTSRGGIEVKDVKTGEPLWGRYAKTGAKKYRAPQDFPGYGPIREKPAKMIRRPEAEQQGDE